jgi:hypothetical protein
MATKSLSPTVTTGDLEKTIRKVLSEILDEVSNELVFAAQDQTTGATASSNLTSKAAYASGQLHAATSGDGTDEDETGEPDDSEEEDETDDIPPAVLTAVKVLCRDLSSEQAIALASLFTAISRQTDEDDETEAQLVVTDTLVKLATRKPAEFQATVDALTPYVVEHDDGMFTIKAPNKVIKGVDQDSYAALLDSLEKANQMMQDGTLGADEALRRIPRIPWAKIYRIVKRRGKWVWYKVNRCAGAVARKWPEIIQHSPDPQDWAMEAALICGNAMRK